MVFTDSYNTDGRNFDKRLHLWECDSRNGRSRAMISVGLEVIELPLPPTPLSPFVRKADFGNVQFLIPEPIFWRRSAFPSNAIHSVYFEI